jgi:hypothetical protein
MEFTFAIAVGRFGILEKEAMQANPPGQSEGVGEGGNEGRIPPRPR